MRGIIRNEMGELNPDPIVQFQLWYDHAKKAGILRRFFSFVYPPATLHQPDSMTLATSTRDGKPSARIVLFKGMNPQGFTFYTNYQSRKAQELIDNPQASLVFQWGFPERQVRVEGKTRKLSYQESSIYWNSRPKGSRISALASEQSHPVPDREFLVKKVRELEHQYPGNEVPCPVFWGGFCLEPERIEFWEARINRLHDRICYTRADNKKWEQVRLAP